MRLIITGPAKNLWGRLAPETAEEAETLGGCAARGDPTRGRGPAAIAALRALAARLGHPVRVTEEQEAHEAPPPRLMVVQRGESALAERLRAVARPWVPLILDRRHRERRTPDGPVPGDRRRKDRRGSPPATWSTLRFLVVRATEPPW